MQLNMFFIVFYKFYKVSEKMEPAGDCLDLGDGVSSSSDNLEHDRETKL